MTTRNEPNAPKICGLSQFGVVAATVPVVPSAHDHEAVRRFPRGFPHIVGITDHDGEVLYGLRMRGMNGRFDLVGEATANLEKARLELSYLVGHLNAASGYLEFEELERLKDLIEATWPPEAFQYQLLFGLEGFGWPHLDLLTVDAETLRQIPCRSPVLLRDTDIAGEHHYVVAEVYDGDLRWEYSWHSCYTRCLAALEKGAITRLCHWEKEHRPSEQMTVRPR